MEEEVAASMREDTQVTMWGQKVETGWTTRLLLLGPGEKD